MRALIAALEAARVDGPVLVLDHDAMTANLAHLAARLPVGLGRRVAVKSLPAPDLMDAALAGLGTRDIMAFDLTLTARVLDRWPDATVLMGKPLPTASVARFGRPGVIWLADTATRAAELAALGAEVAFEVDVGLGRGGFRDPAALAQAVALPGLRPRGIMGYDAQVAALPRALGGGTRAMRTAMARLKEFAKVIPGGIVNTGGSTTALMLDAPAATEVTVGSAVVKPAAFDQPWNAGLRPALFIAVPVLKTVPHGLPSHPRLSRVLRTAGAIRDRIAFGWGGGWDAVPVWPENLGRSPFYGPSANQQGWTLPRGMGAPDRIVLRPAHAEGIIDRFGRIIVVKGGAVTDTWPVWPPG